jgi:hypothetical protein
MPSYADYLKIFALLGCDAAQTDVSWQAISPIFKGQAVKMGGIGYHGTSVTYYQYTLRNIPEERRTHLQRGGNLNHEPATFIPLVSSDSDPLPLWLQQRFQNYVPQHTGVSRAVVRWVAKNLTIQDATGSFEGFWGRHTEDSLWPSVQSRFTHSEDAEWPQMWLYTTTFEFMFITFISQKFWYSHERRTWTSWVKCVAAEKRLIAADLGHSTLCC